MDLPFNPVTIALLLNPLGEVDVVICPFVKLVKINWWNRAHILGPKLQCLQWFIMEAQDVLPPFDVTQSKMAPEGIRSIAPGEQVVALHAIRV